MKYGLKRQKSISSQAESISAWKTVLLWLSMVAALAVSRQGPASRSAARSSTEARSSQLVSLHSRQASLAALAAASTSGAPAWWKVASTCWWSCGQTAWPTSPVRTSLPPMMSGISIRSDDISFSRFLRDFFSGEPGAYDRTGSLVGTARGRIALDIARFSPSGMERNRLRSRSRGHRIAVSGLQGGPGEEQEAQDHQEAADGGDRPQQARPAQGEPEDGAAEDHASQQQAPPRGVDPPQQAVQPPQTHGHQGEAAVHEIAGRRLPELQLPRLQARRERVRPESAGDHRESAPQGAQEEPAHGRESPLRIIPSQGGSDFAESAY